MSNIKFIKSLISTVVLSAVICAQTWAADIVASGNNCGANCSWSLDSDGLLTVSGSGKMTSFGTYGAPWFEQRKSITSVNIMDGITDIPCNAFYDASNITDVSIPNSVKTIDPWAFMYTSALTDITIPDSVTYIGPGAFGSSGITKVYCTGAQLSEGNVCSGTNTWGNYIGGDFEHLPFAGDIVHYEKEGNHYNIYDDNGKIVAQYKNASDFGTNKYYERRTSYTPAEAAQHINHTNNNKIIFTFK